MTAALAAKFVPSRPGDASPTRAIFWLLIASVNLPDLDVVMAFFGDPILTIKTHRWITHSVLAAPFFALVPAAIFYRFSKLKDFRLLWLTALTGILLHITCDLVTPYGTMLLAPVSNHRFTLSSQFIVDLYFTLGLLAFILLGKYHSRKKQIWHRAGIAFLVAYLLGTFCIHEYADAKVRRAVSDKHFAFTKISTLPMPLSIFEWGGLVQASDGVQRVFFSVFDTDLVFEELHHASDHFAARARQHTLAQWYFGFAHHPLLYSYAENQDHIVEIRDLQFSGPPRLMKMLGMKRPRSPFTLKFRYNPAGALTGTSFNE